MRIQRQKWVCSGGLLAMLLVPLSGYGQAYIGGGAGQSKYHDVDQVEAACASIGAVCDSDDADTGYKVFAGYRFGEYMAIEGGYIDLGEAQADATAPVVAAATLSARGGYLAVLPQIPIGPSGSIFGRVGLSALDAELVATAPGVRSTDSSGAVGFMFGVGAEIHLSESMSLRAEWERHSTDEALEIAGVSIDAPDIDLASASIVLRF